MLQGLLDELDDSLRYVVEVENKRRLEDVTNYAEVGSRSLVSKKSNSTW